VSHINIEIKARCSDIDDVRSVLNQQVANFRGIDHQVDTYFRVPKGRLKLREGNVENALIFYDREDREGPKQSNVTYSKLTQPSNLKEVLLKSLGVLVVVDKQREIIFIDNVKFHLDQVKGLGTFVEIEAIDERGNIGRDRLFEQCQKYIKLLGIRTEDLLAKSYSDMLLNR
jgi:adenylate cyclase class 2